MYVYGLDSNNVQQLKATVLKAPSRNFKDMVLFGDILYNTSCDMLNILTISRYLRLVLGYILVQQGKVR